MRFRGNEWRREEFQTPIMPEPIFTAYANIFAAVSLEEVQMIRKALIAGTHEMGYMLPPPAEMYEIADVEDVVVTHPETGIETKAVVVGPKGYKERGKKLPMIYSIHGGGLCLFDHKDELKTYMSMAHKLNCLLISPDYPLIPEYTYKETMASINSVVDWFIENQNELLIDIDKVVVRGISTGAHLSAAISHMRKVQNDENNDPNGFQFAAQMLRSPILDDRPSYKSSDLDCGSWDPVLAATANKLWLGDDFGQTHVPEWAFPMRASSFKGLPPTFLHVSELDHDRDSCLQYAQNLLDEGIFVELNLWGGAAHAAVGNGSGQVGERIKQTTRAQLKEGLTGRLVRRNLKEDENFRK